MSEINIKLLMSMPKIFDAFGNEMSVHFRTVAEGVEVIINRACQECTSFHRLGSGDEVCDKCTYLKNWLQRGKR